MVCLNDTITFKKLTLRDNLIKELVNEVDRKYYLHNGPGLEKIDGNTKMNLSMSIISDVNKIIKNRIKELFENNNFIYINMDDNICSHIFKKGKYEGHFCCKKITKNGNKKKYVCTKHNPDHIPVKKKYVYKDSIIDSAMKLSNKVMLSGKPYRKIFKNKFKKKIKKKIKVFGEINFKNIIERLLI